jgi:alkanesulfonate monooxygenase SsuD/methylene tetrahydromethanopterin reductase-like flavin-dependent oxidoreductase (luciferase family)
MVGGPPARSVAGAYWPGEGDAVTRLGVLFQPRFPPERLRGVVEAADDAGLEDVWLWEDCFLESGIATAAAALAWTERLTVGIGVLPVPLRNAPSPPWRWPPCTGCSPAG